MTYCSLNARRWSGNCAGGTNHITSGLGILKNQCGVMRLILGVRWMGTITYYTAVPNLYNQARRVPSSRRTDDGGLVSLNVNFVDQSLDLLAGQAS